MHGLAVYAKEGLPLAWVLSLENSVDSYLCFRLALLYSVSYFFFLYQSLSPSLCTSFGCISSTIDEIFSISSSAKVFFFRDFKIHHKDWLSYIDGTDRPGKLCYNFSFSIDLTQIIYFPTRISDCDSHSPAVLDYFLSSNSSICSIMDFPSLENSDHVVVSVPIDFPTNSKRNSPFFCIACDYSRADWDNLLDDFRDVPWENIFKLSDSAVASDFCEWFQVGINVYILHQNDQAKSH